MYSKSNVYIEIYCNIHIISPVYILLDKYLLYSKSKSIFIFSAIYTVS